MPIFFSKKRKKEMIARRKKRKRTGNNDGKVENDAIPIENEKETKLIESTISNTAFHEDTKNKNKSKTENKRNSKSKNNDMIVIDGKLIIRVPPGLDNHQTKKFRKDVRRKARKRQESDHNQQLSYNEILFLNEDDPLPISTIPPPKPLPAHKKQKNQFPKINDLLAADKRAKAQQDDRDKMEKSLSKISMEEKEKYIGLDCEMVGVGAGGKQSALARVSLTNFDGDILMDTFVQVMEKVTDFRTHVSGVRSKDIKANKNKNAMDFNKCRIEVGKMLMNKILVGHALKHDLKVLLIDHPKKDIRDTSKFQDFMKVTGKNGGKLRPRKLKDLAKEKLNLDIQQDGEAHSSIDDARAAMELYKSVRSKWENQLRLK